MKTFPESLRCPILACALPAFLVLALGRVSGEEGSAADDSSRPDRVELQNGAVLEGFVVDPGDNRILVDMGGGARTLLKREVARVDFNANRRASTRLPMDRVEFKDGHKIEGKVEVVDGGKRIRVSIPGSKGGKEKTVVLDAADVKIRWKDELLSADSKYYTRELGQRIDETLGKLDAEDEAVARGAVEYLIECGIFAIQKVEETLAEIEKREAERGALSELERRRARALREVLRVWKIKETMPAEIQDDVPEIYAVLHEGSADEKISLLKHVFSSRPEEGVELAVFLVEDTLEEPAVRAMAVDFLRRMQKNSELVNVYNRSSGQVQLVAAVALARNRILLGAPTLIEALSLDSEDLRELAAQTLREASGRDFRFRAEGTVSARQAAIARWRTWWEENRETIEKTGKLVLRGGKEETPQWQQAKQLWKEAHRAWKEKELSDARLLLEEALATEPLFADASISLAVLLYAELGRVKEAERLLEELLQSPVAGQTDRENYWIHLELAHVYRLQEKYGKALEHYEECLAYEPDSIVAVVGKADCQWSRATGRGEVSNDERRELLREALKGYERARELVEASLQKLVLLRARDIPELETLPFERRLHNQEVIQTRSGYEKEFVELYRKSARVYSVLDRHEDAILMLRKGIDYLELVRQSLGESAGGMEADLRSHLGLVYERLGKDILALREYRHVLRELDAGHEYSKQGLRRLRKKVDRRGESRPGG